MINKLRMIRRNSRIFNYGFVERDLWVKEKVSSINPGSKVLDVGAGSAPYRSLFNNCEYRTHDFAQLGEGQNRAGEAYTAIDYVSDITEIPVPNHSFDVIVCTEVLEHVPEPIKVIHEISRIIKPGGFVILSAPLSGYVHQEPYHFYGGFSNFWYEKFLSDAGFENILVEKNGGFFKHFGAQSVRFVNSIAPKIVCKNAVAKVVYSPFWIVLVGIFGISIPFACHYIDKLDDTLYATAGYHVTATKQK